MSAQSRTEKSALEPPRVKKMRFESQFKIGEKVEILGFRWKLFLGLICIFFLFAERENLSKKSRKKISKFREVWKALKNDFENQLKIGEKVLKLGFWWKKIFGSIFILLLFTESKNSLKIEEPN